jgi:1-deoxy-D-xylulose-5-phosphate synthase
VLITMEEGSVCGFGGLVMQHLAWQGASTRAEAPPDVPAGHLHRPRDAEEAVRPARLNAPQIVETAGGAGQGRARRAGPA